ncbi:MAG: hypothetical protein WA888_09105 [Burkholderiaceae bacterium]
MKTMHQKLSQVLVLAGFIGLPGLITSPVQAKDFSRMTEREIDKELAVVINKGRQLQDLSRLQSTGNTIAQPNQCGRLHAQAVQSHKQLVQLQAESRQRGNRQLRQSEQQLRQQNANAIREYRQCFNEALRDPSLRWPEKGIVDYVSFERLFGSLAVQLRGESEAKLQAEAEQLYAAKQSFGQVSKFAFGSILTTSGDVQLVRKDRQVRIAKGINVNAGDQFTTGRNGSVEVQFTEVVGKTRRGPFVFSIGPSSKIAIGWQSNMVVQDRKNESIGLEVSLVYGTLRIKSIGAGFDSNYLVRSGQSQTQMLGADAVVTYYPKRDLSNSKLRSGVAEVSHGSSNPIRLKPNQQLSIRGGVIQAVSDLPANQWEAALIASGSSDQPPPGGDLDKKPGREIARADVQRRVRARASVDAMLIALRSANANGLLTSTSGEAQRNARNSMRRQSLRDVLNTSGKPVTWFHDCVACTSDGYCAVPTEVKLDGGPSRKYEALHVVKPTANDRGYTVDRIAPWDENAQKLFRANKPLCEADLSQSGRR